MLDTYGIIQALRLITSASRLTTLTPCYTIRRPALLARDESQQPSRRNGAGFVLPSRRLVMRRCSICKQEKPLEAFNKNRTLPLGRAYQCKECRSAKRDREKDKAYAKQHYWENPARGRGAINRWKQKNDAAIREYRRVYYAQNRGAVLAKVKQYYRDNLDERRGYSARHRILARASRMQNSRQYHALHREERNQVAREYRRNHPEKGRAYGNQRRAYKRGNGGRYTGAEWLELKAQYHNMCLCCGKKDSVTKLTVDHVIPLSKGGSNAIDNIQPLCLACNLHKGTKSTDYRQALRDIGVLS